MEYNHKVSDWIKNNQGLIWGTINRELNANSMDVEPDDLYQVACIGVMMGFKALENKPLNCNINTAMVYRMRSYIGFYYRTQAKHEKLKQYYNQLVDDVEPTHKSAEYKTNIELTLRTIRKYITLSGNFELMYKLDALMEHIRGRILLKDKEYTSYLLAVRNFSKRFTKGVML